MTATAMNRPLPPFPSIDEMRAYDLPAREPRHPHAVTLRLAVALASGLLFMIAAG